MSVGRRGSLAVSTARMGAPITTPMAYPVTSSPACGMLTARSAATSGSNPMMTNSLVPIAKAATASAMSAYGMLREATLIPLVIPDRARRSPIDR